VSAATLYAWKSKYAGMQASDARRLRQLEEENRRLKHMVADLSLDKEAMKAVIAKNGWSS
jgi:putative transposase